jgi:hypothetical protein
VTATQRRNAKTFQQTVFEGSQCNSAAASLFQSQA